MMKVSNLFLKYSEFPKYNFPIAFLCVERVLHFECLILKYYDINHLAFDYLAIKCWCCEGTKYTFIKKIV